MAESENLYHVLGVAPDADLETIRKAHRKLARQYHPDLNPGDAAAEERFKEVSRAWEVLQDPAKRRDYDEFGEISLEAGFDADQARHAREAFGQRFGGGGFPGGQAGEFEFGDLDDLMGRFFGGGSGRAQGVRMPGQDVEATLELEFADAVRGGEKRLTLGRPEGPETIRVRIPPGVDDGGRLRVPGKGGPGAGGGVPGDLWVRLRVRPHRIFRRNGRDLQLDVPVTVSEAIRGAAVEVPTLDGTVTLQVPAGSDSGTRLRLRGKGVPAGGGRSAGDLIVRIEIRVPRELDDDAREALAEIERVEDGDVRKELFA